MTYDGRLRASDQDRDAAVDVLRDAYVAGRLPLEEFDQRVDVAFAARTWGELERVTEDLPTALRRPQRAAASSAGTNQVNVRGTRALTWFLAVHAILVVLIVLTVALAERVTTAAVWSAYALIPLALLLPTIVGRRHLARRLGRSSR
jgi:Flp pilus assembly protein TadB